jgi:hypothetical protein
MKKVIITISIFSFLYIPRILAQTNIKASDMLMMSQTYSWGTARVMGMAGSFGSLGGDMSSLSLNPAGIGVYRTSDLSFTPSVNYISSSSNFYNLTNEDFFSKFNFGNIGYVYTYNSNKDYGWVSASFGLAFNRINDFNRNVFMKTESATSSLLDEFAYYANGGDGINNTLGTPMAPENLYEFYEGLAWETYALDRGLFNGNYYNSDYSTGNNTYNQQQKRTRTIKGGINDYSMTFGANYSHKFYLGATLGIQRVKYEEEMVHSEDDINGSVPYLSWFDFIENLNIYGTGYNFKAGFIYKPIDLLRIGFAAHTPTFYNLRSEFYTFMESKYDSAFILTNDGYVDNAYATTNLREAKNRLRTPWKFLTSLGLQFGSFGVVNIDWEHINYGDMHLSGDMVNYQNIDVNDFYKSANNIRAGGEIKLDNFALRGGYGFVFDKDNGIDNYTTYSAGIGYRGKKAYIDFAYNLLQYSNKYLLYQWVERYDSSAPELPSYSYEPVEANVDYKVNRFVLTVGFKF